MNSFILFGAMSTALLASSILALFILIPFSFQERNWLKVFCAGTFLIASLTGLGLGYFFYKSQVLRAEIYDLQQRLRSARADIELATHTIFECDNVLDETIYIMERTKE